MSPVLEGNWLQRASMPVYLGGAELNVATALAGWELPVCYGTALPDNYLSREICAALQRRKIDVSPIRFSGKRIGLYYLPQGTDLKNAAVIYDREHSSFSTLQRGMIPWEELLKGVGWFHFSAISPGLNPQVADVCLEALEIAAAKGISISVDLNYRARLWQYGKPAPEVMHPLLKYCDVVMGNIWSANALLGIPVDEDIHARGSRNDYLEHAVRTANAIMELFPKCSTIANTFRFDQEGGGILYYASLVREKQAYNSVDFVSHNIKDKVGTGDCFMAGLIYGLYQKLPMQELVNFAAAAAFGKFHEEGDATRQDLQTIQARMTTHG